jgi:hypothetical protein
MSLFCVLVMMARSWLTSARSLTLHAAVPFADDCDDHPDDDSMMDLGCRLPREALREHDYYMDTHRLRISASNMKNTNTREQLEAVRNTVLENLSRINAAPSAHMAPRPPAHAQVLCARACGD